MKPWLSSWSLPSTGKRKIRESGDIGPHRHVGRELTRAPSSKAGAVCAAAHTLRPHTRHTPPALGGAREGLAAWVASGSNSLCLNKRQFTSSLSTFLGISGENMPSFPCNSPHHHPMCTLALNSHPPILLREPIPHTAQGHPTQPGRLSQGWQTQTHSPGWVSSQSHLGGPALHSHSRLPRPHSCRQPHRWSQLTLGQVSTALRRPSPCNQQALVKMSPFPPSIRIFKQGRLTEILASVQLPRYSQQPQPAGSTWPPTAQPADVLCLVHRMSQNKELAHQGPDCPHFSEIGRMGHVYVPGKQCPLRFGGDPQSWLHCSLLSRPIPGDTEGDLL